MPGFEAVDLRFLPVHVDHPPEVDPTEATRAASAWLDEYWTRSPGLLRRLNLVRGSLLCVPVPTSGGATATLTQRDADVAPPPPRLVVGAGRHLMAAHSLALRDAERGHVISVLEEPLTQAAQMLAPARGPGARPSQATGRDAFATAWSFVARACLVAPAVLIDSWPEMADQVARAGFLLFAHLRFGREAERRACLADDLDTPVLKLAAHPLAPPAVLAWVQAALSGEANRKEAPRLARIPWFGDAVSAPAQSITAVEGGVEAGASQHPGEGARPAPHERSTTPSAAAAPPAARLDHRGANADPIPAPTGVRRGRPRSPDSQHERLAKVLRNSRCAMSYEELQLHENLKGIKRMAVVAGRAMRTYPGQIVKQGDPDGFVALQWIDSPAESQKPR